MKSQISYLNQIFVIIALALIGCFLTAGVFAEGTVPDLRMPTGIVESGLSQSIAEIKESKWPGVDESVVEKFAKEHGREAREPFINTDQGDLLLFVFLLAGTAGGFIAGYYWKELMVNKERQRTNGNI